MRLFLFLALTMLWCWSAVARAQVSKQWSAKNPYGALTLCGPSDRGNVEAILNAGQPLAILVQGCNASLGRFHGLAEVFALHGQQALCYGYDDRRRIQEVGRELARTITALHTRLRSDVTLLGHSQGGLVARAAATKLGMPSGAQRRAPLRLTLVTVSSPFNGVRAAKDCGATWMHVLSFGVTLAVCRGIAGAKWRDIHQGSALVRSPARLSDAVRSHFEIRTDERGSCRRYARDGRCARSDYVFSLSEQENPRMARDARITTDIVRSGHVAVVGNDNVVPYELLSRLQQHHVLRPTPRGSSVALHALLNSLF